MEVQMVKMIILVSVFVLILIFAAWVGRFLEAD